MKYVSVIIDRKANALDREFVYKSGFDDIRRGDKVFIPFGNSKSFNVGYVLNVLEDEPSGIKNIKEIISVEREAALNLEMMETAIFMSERYFLRKIDAINCFTVKKIEARKEKKNDNNLKQAEYNLKLTG